MLKCLKKTIKVDSEFWAPLCKKKVCIYIHIYDVNIKKTGLCLDN